MKMRPYQRRAWAEVYIDNLKYNFDMIRNTAKATKVCCVIKANAYGHGAVRLGRLYERWGADFLAVSNIEEALQLRRAGINLPILNLGYCPPACAGILARENVSQCVFSREYAAALSENAKAAGVSVKIHIKIDTGMGRLGFDGKQGDISEIEGVYRLPSLFFEGVFTHFSVADEGKAGEEYTRAQHAAFCRIVQRLEGHGISVGIRHAAGSAAIFAYPETHLDMVRAGIALYGISSSAPLRPALALRTVVSHLKEVRAGDSIGYGRAFVAPKTMKVATLPVGYADGLWRSNYPNRLRVALAEGYAPIVGRICMDQCMVDVTEISGAEIGATVTVYSLFGENSVEKVAQKNGTIGYEILCAIGARVPRIYTKTVNRPHARIIR